MLIISVSYGPNYWPRYLLMAHRIIEVVLCLFWAHIASCISQNVDPSKDVKKIVLFTYTLGPNCVVYCAAKHICTFFRICCILLNFPSFLLSIICVFFISVPRSATRLAYVRFVIVQTFQLIWITVTRYNAIIRLLITFRSI